VQNFKKGFQPKITVCRDKTTNLIAGEQLILNRWAEYFEEHLSSNAMQPLNAEIVFLVQNCTYLYPLLQKCMVQIEELKIKGLLERMQ
jgi:hypothetical protein